MGNYSGLGCSSCTASDGSMIGMLPENEAYFDPELHYLFCEKHKTKGSVKLTEYKAERVRLRENRRLK